MLWSILKRPHFEDSAHKAHYKFSTFPDLPLPLSPPPNDTNHFTPKLAKMPQIGRLTGQPGGFLQRDP